MAVEDLWYKNAIIYCLDVEKYMDGNGDGVGDFEGLTRKLPYLAGLGVTCLWLLPFYRSPNRDNGYDIVDYYSVHEKHGSLGDFVEFMSNAKAFGMRVIIDLVVNHTSNEHPWFNCAKDAQSKFRDWYVWSRERPDDHDTGMVFPGIQETTWTYDKEAKEYYFHRFYEFQPDLNTHNLAVREEILKIMGFWLQLGVSGFRMDAVPFLIERKGANVEHEKDYALLHEMRDFLQWRAGDAIMLAEANVPPEESLRYFGAEGENIQLMLNFPVNQRLFLALATGDIGPLRWALEDTAKRPQEGQWVQFLRSHDECDLGRLSEEERQQVFAAFAPDEDMQLYGRGIRRRLAPMLGNDRRRLELAYSLLFGLPGTPMMQYGDEIGMGDDLSLPERECARTPMQWTADKHGGFSRAECIIRPAIDDPEYGFQKVNVATSQRQRDSLLNWTERMIRARKECLEISWGSFSVLDVGVTSVLAIRYDWRSTTLITLHNFAENTVTCNLNVEHPQGEDLFDVLGNEHSCGVATKSHSISLSPYGYRWLRVGSLDPALERSPLKSMSANVGSAE